MSPNCYILAIKTLCNNIIKRRRMISNYMKYQTTCADTEIMIIIISVLNLGNLE